MYSKGIYRECWREPALAPAMAMAMAALLRWKQCAEEKKGGMIKAKCAVGQGVVRVLEA